jgi:hypothetical protein
MFNEFVIERLRFSNMRLTANGVAIPSLWKGGFMITIDQFKYSASRYTRCTLATVLGSVFAVVLAILLIKVFHDPLLSFYVQWFGESTAAILISISPFPAILILFGSLWYSERRLSRDPCTRCPSCAKQIACMRQIVIATRNCPHCGQRVLQEPLNPMNVAVK